MQVEVETALGDAGGVLGLHGLPHHVEPGDLLQCHHYFSEALIGLWKPRWQKASLVGTEQWNRIMGFIQAYMPRLQFPEPDFSLQRWRTALNHFPARPAKGVDGIDVADLKHLPGNITSNLLDFLAKVNGAETPWPTQLLYGTVLSLAKQDQSHLPSHFRPVAILGTVYRT